jgi:predicted CoA-binding protein
MPETVAIVGASPKPERYSNRAMHELLHHGHSVFLVHPVLKTIETFPVYPSLDELPGSVDTVTMYVSKEASASMLSSLLSIKPKRVIFNPGAENPELQAALISHGIKAVEQCTLVLLSTRQF